MIKQINSQPVEILLGIAMGLGHLTSFRFFGPVGISEILFLITFICLLVKQVRRNVDFNSNYATYLALYFIVSFFIILPLVTLTSFYMSINESTPMYIMSYMIGGGGVILLYLSQSEGFDFKTVTIYFAVVFILSNAIFLNYFDNVGRYSGGADNPNQLLFYGSSLSLLISIYLRKSQFFIFPVLIFIMISTGSDAYNLSLFICIVVYVSLRLLFFKKLNFYIGVICFILFMLMSITGLFYFYLDSLVEIWNSADEGGARLSLFRHAFYAMITSPVFGYGAGAFSGLTAAFQGKEAHNTFLDLATQFGILFPIVLYGLMFSYFLKVVYRRDFWIAGFVAAYIVGTFFHFSARHFVFWVEISVFYYACFGKKKYELH